LLHCSADDCLMTSFERCILTLNFEATDRVPMFDKILNDDVLAHFAGEAATPENALRVIPKATSRAVDSTRLAVSLPEHPRIERRNGYLVRVERWTEWFLERPVNSVEDFVAFIRREIEALSDWTPEKQTALNAQIEEHNAWQARFGDLALMGNLMRKTGVTMYSFVGWKPYAYAMADHPDLLSAYFEAVTNASVRDILNYRSLDAPAYFLCEDIACTRTQLFSPPFLRREFFPRLERIVDAYHRRGAKLIFHSDGNLNEILPDLVAAGIDGLHPVDTGAGMSVEETRKRFPGLVLIGGIDCMHLLPHGTPEQVRQACLQAIRVASPGYFLASTSEIHQGIPLDNFLAMKDAAEEGG